MKRTVLTIVVVFLTASGISQQAPAVSFYDVDEAYRIYDVLLAHEESYEFAKKTLVIRRETVSDQPVKAACLGAEAVKKFAAAIADYGQVNSKGWLLQRRFQIDKPYELVDSATIKAFFKDGVGRGWASFYSRYPESGGFLTVSAVGFNQSKTLAIVHSGSSCGGLCGRWSFHLLEKVEGNWKEVPGVTCFTVS